MNLRPIALALSTLTLAACGGATTEQPVSVSAPVSSPDPVTVSANELDTLIGDFNSYIIPNSTDYDSIPQDPRNRITASKVQLGQMLYHETGVTTAGSTGREGTWSCASCHNAKAGFKAGIAQGIGDGGDAYGFAGEMRIVAPDVNPIVVDHQPVSSPTVLNVAFQDVMLWNGQFGNAEGSINADIDESILSTAGTPKEENALGYSGVEVQALAGIGVHRLNMGEGSIVETNDDYQRMIQAVREKNADTDGLTLHQVAALSIAAFERTVLANQAPFQAYLRGDREAMGHAEIEGAKLFFGKAGCSACHSGPALSSPVGASEGEMFMAIGFADLDRYNMTHSPIAEDDASRLGRGGFTGKEEDNYKFKIPPLYNLANADFFGHGNSFTSVREVIEYKNAAIPQKYVDNLDPRFVPLNLTAQEIDNLVVFIEDALKDDDLTRYEPESLPSDKCIINDDLNSRYDLGCE